MDEALFMNLKCTIGGANPTPQCGFPLDEACGANMLCLTENPGSKEANRNYRGAQIYILTPFGVIAPVRVYVALS